MPNIGMTEDLHPLLYSLVVLKWKIQSEVATVGDSGGVAAPGRVLSSVPLCTAGSGTVRMLMKVCERTISKPGLSYIAGVSLMPEPICIL